MNMWPNHTLHGTKTHEKLLQGAKCLVYDTKKLLECLDNFVCARVNAGSTVWFRAHRSKIRAMMTCFYVYLVDDQYEVMRALLDSNLFFIMFSPTRNANGTSDLQVRVEWFTWYKVAEINRSPTIQPHFPWIPADFLRLLWFPAGRHSYRKDHIQYLTLENLIFSTLTPDDHVII